MKVKRLVDARVVADINNGVMGWYGRTPEKRAKELESLASEFNDFVRDHRSMDWVRLYVEKDFEYQCEFCNYTWELDEEGIPTCCQKSIEEHELNLAKDNKNE